MTPENAIKEAIENGFCKIKPNVFLWSTRAASEHIKFEVKDKPFQLVCDVFNWSDIYPVANAKSKKLVEACK